MKCPHCKFDITNQPVQFRNSFDVGESIDWKCPSCSDWIPRSHWKEDHDASEDKFRPKHYEKGHDTFAWAEHKFDLETNLAICQYNIHRYNDREKGQNVSDLEKIIAYAQRALDLIKEDKAEVTGL